MTVGENIRKYRKQQGLTQKELAELSGLNEVTIRSYEAGKYKPKLENVKKLSSALGTYIGNLIEDWHEYPEIKEKEFIEQLNYVSVSYTDFKKGVERQAKYEEQLLLTDYWKLNSEGQSEARKRVAELTEIPRYTQKEE